jgi:hypothetical protein
MHEGRTPYQCRYCAKAYQNPSNRTAHEKRSHPDLYTKVKEMNVIVNNVTVYRIDSSK